MFKHLEQLKITKEATAELTLYSIMMPNGEHPVLVGCHAGEINKPYFNALLKQNIQRVKQRSNKEVTVEMITENRAEDIELFPKHVLTDWRNVYDEKSKPVEFNQDNCKEFLEAVPTHILDEIRGFFADANNFVGQTVVVEEAEERGKS